MTDELIKEFIGGALQQMGLSYSGIENPVVQVRINGKFAFIEFRTLEEAANALNMNGIPFMNQSLKLSRPSKFEAAQLVPHFTWEELYGRSLTGEIKLMTAGPVSTVIRISNMVSASDLDDPELFAEVLEDTVTECSQFGKVLNVCIPRPTDDPNEYNMNDSSSSKPPQTTVMMACGTNGVGRVFVEMIDEEAAKNTLIALKGRKFDGKWVDVKFYPTDQFKIKNFGLTLPNTVLTKSGALTIDKVLMPRAATGMKAFSSGGVTPGNLMILLPYYYPITTILLSYYTPITTLLLPYCYPITTLLLPYYYPITILLQPYYYPIYSHII